MSISTEDLKNRFSYHPPSSPSVGETHEYIRKVLYSAAFELNNLIPDSREASLALTKIEEAMYWANAAIARNQ